MTFWNYGTPEYNLQTASNLQLFCEHRNGNTTKSHPNFRIKRFTVECGFHLLLEVTDNLVPLCSWERRAGVRIVVDMETRPWELSVKWQHDCETWCACVWLELMVPRLFLNYMRTSRPLSSRKLMNSWGTTDIFAQYNQQDATFHNLFISVRRSTCFTRVFRPFIRSSKLHIPRQAFVRPIMLEASWNAMAHAQKPDFVFRRNGGVHLIQRGLQFSRLLAAEMSR